MGDFDDYELGTGPPDESPPPYRPDPEKKGGALLFPALLALAGIAAIGLLAVLYLVFRTPEAPGPTPTPPSITVPAPTPAPSATPVVLPPLDQSDELVPGSWWRHCRRPGAGALGSPRTTSSAP